MSALEYDAKLVKEFGIKAADDVEDMFKLTYARTQLDEVKKFLWRERVEMQLSEAQVRVQAEKGVEELVDEAKKKVSSHRSNIRGVVASIRVLTELVHELEAKVTD